MAPTFEGFAVLRLPLAAGSTFVRHVLAKRHNSQKGDGWPAKRTLFLTSLDALVTECALKKAMGAFGNVERVTIKRGASKRGGGKDDVLAHVVFKQAGAVEKALSDTVLQAEAVLPLASSGRKAWRAADAALVRDPRKLQREIDQWMEEYEKEEAEEARKLKEPEVDADGFTVVKRGAVSQQLRDGKYKVTIKSFRPPPVDSGALSLGAAPEKKKRKKHMGEDVSDFYTFQWREKRRKAIQEQRDEIERDKETVEAMRKQKKFKAVAAV